VRRAGGLAAAWAAGLLALVPLARAEMFVSPSLEGSAGYLSNRFAEPRAQGTAFWRVAPGLELTAFGPGGLEGWASFRYEHTDFMRPGFSRWRRASGRGGAAWRTRETELSGAVGVGVYEDGAVPGDDLTWFRVESSLSRELGRGWWASIAFAFETDRYASRRTVGGDLQRDYLWEASPGVRVGLSERVSVWVELRLDGLGSNEPAEEWIGSGVSAGVEGEWGPVRAGWDAGVRRMRYRARDRTDTPVWAGGWAAFRLAPGLELTASAGWTGVRSTDPADDYDTWRVEGGVRVVYDLDPH